MTIQYEILFPLSFLIISTLVFIWYGIYVKHKIINYNLAEHFGFISIFILCLTLMLELYSFNRYYVVDTFDSISSQTLSAFNFFFIATPLTSLISIITLVLAILSILISVSNERTFDLETSNNTILEVNVLRLFIVFSLNLIVLSDNLVVIFLLLEIYSLSSYVLVGRASKYSLFSSESAIKYFFISTTFSIVMVFSLASIYASVGLLDISSLKLFFYSSDMIYSHFKFYFFSMLLMVSIFFKLAAAPFHFWAPDVYEGAPYTIMLFLGVVPKIVLFYILVKTNVLFNPFLFFFIISAFLSIFIGSVVGIFQLKIKRLLAYSMITNTGVLMGLLSANPDNLLLGYFFIYMFIYSLTLIGLFGLFMTNQVSYTGKILKNIYNLTNLKEINKTKFIIFICLLFSSAGIPPFIGFFIKFLVLLSYSQNSLYLYGLVIFAILVLSFNVYYYIKLLKIMSFANKRFWIFYAPASYYLVIVIVMIFILTIISMIWIDFLVNLFVLCI